jgi:hypothetical protein
MIAYNFNENYNISKTNENTLELNNKEVVDIVRTIY